MAENQTLDIVLPCYDPILGWEKSIIKFYNEISTSLPNIDIKLIIVNDGTEKKLSDELSTIKNIIPTTIIVNDKNYGKGYSVRTGVSNSVADNLIYTDVDFPYTTKSFCKVFHSLKEADVVLGIRDEKYYDELPRSRERISKMLKNLNLKLLKLKTADTQCGLKGMNQKGKEVLLQTSENRYLFDLEFVKFLSNDKDIDVKLEVVKLRDGVTFSKVPTSKILGEIYSYLKVLLGR